MTDYIIIHKDFVDDYSDLVAIDELEDGEFEDRIIEYLDKEEE